MKTSDLFNLKSSKKLNEGMAKAFGKKIQFETFSNEQLEDARNKLRTQLSQTKGNSGFNENLENETYHQAQWMLDAINAEIAERESGGQEPTVKEDEMDPNGTIQAAIEKFLATNPKNGDDLQAFHHKAIDDKNKELDDYLTFLYDYVADQTGAGGTEEAGVYDEMLDTLIQMMNDKGWSEGQYDGKSREELMKMKAEAEASIKNMQSSGNDPQSKFYDETQMMMAQQHLDFINDALKKVGKTVEDHGPEDPDAEYNQGEYDREGDMAKDQLRTVNDAAKELYSIIHADENLPEWVQSKITKAMDYLDTARDYMKSNKYAENIESQDDVVAEGEVQQASAIVTAKTMVDRVGRWIDELSGMENETLLQLGDSIRDEMGAEQSRAFIEATSPAIEQALENLKTTRETLASAMRQLTGEEASTDMLGAEPEVDAEPDVEPAPADEMNAEPAADEFAASEPATGGEEVPGREQRESIDRSSKYLRLLAG